MGEIEIKGIKGESNDILELLKASDCELSGLLKSPRKAKFGYRTFVWLGVFYIALLCFLWYVPCFAPAIQVPVAIVALGMAGVIAILVRIYQRDNWVTALVVLFSIMMLLIAYGAITPEAAGSIINEVVTEIK